MRSERTRAQGLALVITATVVASTVFQLAGLPSAVMFGSLFGGVAHARTSSTDLRLPPALFRLGQALVGVVVARRSASRRCGRWPARSSRSRW